MKDLKKRLKIGGDSQLGELIKQYEKKFSPKMDYKKGNQKKSLKNKDP